jgi:hypothetical protein
LIRPLARVPEKSSEHGSSLNFAEGRLPCETPAQVNKGDWLVSVISVTRDRRPVDEPFGLRVGADERRWQKHDFLPPRPDGQRADLGLILRCAALADKAGEDAAMEEHTRPRGVFPMLYAFFDERGALDRRAFRQQVEAVVGAHGVAVLGLMTEVGALSPAERRTLVGWAVEDVAGRAPLMATIDRAADWDPERAGLSRLRPGNRK